MQCPNEHSTDPHRVIIFHRSVITNPDNLIEVPWNVKGGKVGDAEFTYVLPIAPTLALVWSDWSSARAYDLAFSSRTQL